MEYIMKSFTFFLFILLPGFMNGYENSTVNDHLANDMKNVLSVEKQAKVVTQKIQQVPLENVKKKIKTNVIKKTPKYKVKRPKQKIKKRLAKVEQVKSQKALDLKLPLNIYGPTAAGNTSIHKKRSYLPDLFASKKNKNKYPLQVDGKIIERVEQEKDKERVADGVGLDFRLLP